jgi:hypothetical protein
MGDWHVFGYESRSQAPLFIRVIILGLIVRPCFLIIYV